MKLPAKVVPYAELELWRGGLSVETQPLVVTNGCFDLLHAGHVICLQAARKLGASLLVGINDDASVRQLKGENRPVVAGEDRAVILAALECVSAVCIFPGKSASDFLLRARPDIYVKGGDYSLASLNPIERDIIESFGAKVVIVPSLPGRSTSALLNKLPNATARSRST